MASSDVDDAFVKGNFEFSMNLYSKLVQNKSVENIIFSPFSIQTCLALLHAGAAGATADEIATGLCLPSKDRTEVAKTFENILNAYKDNSLIKVANKVYVKTGYELKSEFNQIATKSFYSEAQNVNFGDGKTAADTINSWVESKTNNKIKNLIDSNSLDSDTRAVLVNAIYFKGLWNYKFDPELTHKDKFYINEKDTIEVDMMELENVFKYKEFANLDATALELPYNDSELSLLIVLPNKKTGLGDLEQKLSSLSVADLTMARVGVTVNVKLPRFRIEFSTELTETLQQLGIKRIFGNADFSNLLKTSEPLQVNQVLHKAFIEINEEGTEAAGVAAIMIVPFSALSSETIAPIYFEVNRPFLFILKSNKTIFFIGRVINPINNNSNSDSNNNNPNNNNGNNDNNKRCNCHKQAK